VKIEEAVGIVSGWLNNLENHGLMDSDVAEKICEDRGYDPEAMQSSLDNLREASCDPVPVEFYAGAIVALVEGLTEGQFKKPSILSESAITPDPLALGEAVGLLADLAEVDGGWTAEDLWWIK
jgi:hypothetical protein